MALPLTPSVDVTYNLPASGGVRTGFNLGLIVGPSQVISPTTRVVVYSSVDEMLDAGFSNTSPEYLAAVVYFAATGRPSQVAIGVIDSGETPLAAIQACRVANNEWYIAYFADTATDEEQLDVADYIEAAQPYSQYAINSGNVDIKNGVYGNLFEALANGDYRRTFGLFSAEPHAVCSIMGYAMANTSDAPGSAYTLKFKTLPGIETDNLTTQQVNNVEDNNGNVYINRGMQFDWYENGTQFSGDFFDEIIGLDKLANDIETGVANLLYQTPSVPQTEDGMALINTVIGQSCQRAVTRGFLAPGQWNGLPVLTLQTGDYLGDGYLVLSQPINSQSQQDRDQRIAPPIYVAVKLAGSLQSVTIQINVNR